MRLSSRCVDGHCRHLWWMSRPAKLTFRYYNYMPTYQWSVGVSFCRWKCIGWWNRRCVHEYQPVSVNFLSIPYSTSRPLNKQVDRWGLSPLLLSMNRSIRTIKYISISKENGNWHLLEFNEKVSVPPGRSKSDRDFRNVTRQDLLASFGVCQDPAEIPARKSTE